MTIWFLQLAAIRFRAPVLRWETMVIRLVLEQYGSAPR